MQSATTLNEFLELGGTRADLAHDISKGYTQMLPANGAAKRKSCGGQQGEGPSKRPVGLAEAGAEHMTPALSMIDWSVIQRTLDG